MAISAGLLLTAAFPNIGVAGAAWLAPGLMVATALGKSPGEAFRIGYSVGLAHYLSMLYWLLLIPYRWHGIPLGPAAGWLALSGFLALFPAFWVWLVAPVQSPKTKVTYPKSEEGNAPATTHGHRAESTSTKSRSPVLDYTSQPVERGVLARNWVRRTVWGISGAAAWVALEMVLARFLGGFPWDLLGVSQYALLPLIQVASVTGVYGVSFLIVWVSLALLSAGLLVIRRPTQRSVWVAETFLPVIVVAIVFNLGFRHLREESSGRAVKITLVQPSIPQTLIWDGSNDAQRFEDLVHLTEAALTTPTDVLIWPESAVPKMLRYDTNTFDVVTGLARRHRVWMIVGSDDAEPRPNAAKGDDRDYFNSSFLIDPDGKLMERYVKRSLVIFGEYVPLQRWLPFLKYFTPIEDGGFTPGVQDNPFILATLDLQTSVLICFEDIFPHLARRDMNPQTVFFVNITNDGWFGRGAAQWQHCVSGLFRAVENGVPLIRCCNNGLTCWIDDKGRMREILRDEQGTIYGRGVLQVEIPVSTPGQQKAPTFYTRHGDWFGWACVAIGGLMLARRFPLRIWGKKAETISR
jgi:apolipoprotein N-acyltransferase